MKSVIKRLATHCFGDYENAYQGGTIMIIPNELEAFYKAVFNAGLEAAAMKVIESPGIARYDLATAIRGMKK